MSMIARATVCRAAMGIGLGHVAVVAISWCAAISLYRSRRRRRALPALLLPDVMIKSTRLSQRSFIVTGGAQGVGEAVARALAAEGAVGVTIADVDATKAEAVQKELVAEPFCCRTLVVQADLSKPDDCARVVAAHDAEFRGVHGLVNCAASTARGYWDDTSAEFFDNMLALNVRAPFLLMQAVGRLMERDGHGCGSIVNIGSVHAHGGSPKLVAYAASKGALLTLVRPSNARPIDRSRAAPFVSSAATPLTACIRWVSLAQTKNFAFAKRKQRIRANYIILGWVATPTEHKTMMSEGLAENWLESVADASHPFGRISRPVDVAKHVVHLLSDDACLQTASCVDLHCFEPVTGCWE